MTAYEIKERLIPIALKYDKTDIHEFIVHVGWDPEWMPDYMEDPDAEFISVYDNRRINEVLLEAFESAHQFRFDRNTREDLLNY